MTGMRNDKGESFRSGYMDRSGLSLDRGEDVSAPGDASSGEPGTIHAVSLLVEARDPYTAGHQRRVAQLARAIANKMDLSEWQIKEVQIAGLLHDVGKIVVPMEILSQLGKMASTNSASLRNTPRLGAKPWRS